METSELKRRLAARGRGKRGVGADVKEAVLAYASRRKVEGVSRRAVAAELGMSEQTLWYWASQVRRRTKLAPVQVVHERISELVVEFGPVRVRGLDVASVAELLRRLG